MTTEFKNKYGTKAFAKEYIKELIVKFDILTPADINKYKEEGTHFNFPSEVTTLFSHWSGLRLLNESPPPLETGVMWSISQPYLEPRLPYSERLIHAPHWSFRNTPGSLFDATEPFFQTVSISESE